MYSSYVLFFCSYVFFLVLAYLSIVSYIFLGMSTRHLMSQNIQS